MLPFRRRRARRRGFLLGRISGRRVGATAADDASRELERLADLRDRGALSEEEFEREKRRLLG